MAQIREIAHVTGLDDATDEIPLVDDPDGLERAGRLLRRSIWGKTTPKSPGRRKNGIPGRLWQGALTERMLELWPALPVLADKEEIARIRGVLYGYLVKCNAVVAEQGQGKHTAAVWWVNEHWTPLVERDTESVVEEEAEGEPDEEAPAEAPADGGYQCRLCDRAPFHLVRFRAAHEKLHHRVVIDETGTHLSLDDDAYNDAAIKQRILHAFEGAEGKPQSANAVFSKVRLAEPRVSKSDIQELILELAAGQGGELVRVPINSPYPHYRLRGKTAELKSPDASTAETPEKPTPRIMPKSPGMGSGPVDLPERGAERGPLRGAAASLRKCLAEAIKELSEGHAYVDALEIEVSELRRQLAEVSSTDGEKAKLHGIITGLQDELEKTTASLVAAANALEQRDAALADVTKERDAYRARVEAFTFAFNGVGPSSA